jgi:L-2-hydroxycarboxylate dehydrogenase (NAD+)
MNEDQIRDKLSKRRNIPPKHGIRIPAEAMQTFIAALFAKAGLSAADAQLLGEILTGNDLRCVFSHGTSAAQKYLEQLREGGINPRPEIKVVHEAPGALVLDGDGGLGYFPCWRGTEQIIAKAKECGSAVLTTRNHHHFGAAGNYTRRAIAHGCIGLAASSHRSTRDPDRPIYSTISSSPLSIGVPTRDQPPLVLDMGGGIVGFSQHHFASNHASFFKSFGLSNLIQVLGSAVAGIYLEECVKGRWIANQGAFIAVFDTAHLMPEGQVQAQVDQYVGDARRMQPIPGTDRAELTGGNEWTWERENRESGIPLGDKHRERLEELAADWSVDSPFTEWEATRF